MRATTYRLGGLVGAALLAGVIALEAGQALAQSNAGTSRLPQASARQKETVGGSAASNSVNSRRENQQRQKAMKSGTSDNAPPKTVP